MRTNDVRPALRDRVLSAGLWSIALRGLLRGVGLIRNIVLARILSPADFGLFGIILVILSVLERFSNTGLQSALIQKAKDVTDYLDTAWTVQAVRGIALGGGMFLAAPYFASFFREPNAVSLIRVLAIVLALRGLQSPALVTFIRELDFRSKFFRRAAGNVIELLVSIVFAVIMRNAWALMLGLVAGTVANLFVSYRIHPFRPQLRFQISQARELGRYGRWIFLNEMLFFLSYRGDNLIVGKLFGSTALGVYMLAYSISEVVTVEIARLVNDVAFPAYSRLQGEIEKIRSAFILSGQLVASVAFPVAILLALLAKPLVSFVLGERWIQVSTVLPPLALAGALRAAVANASAVYRAIGRPQLSFRISLIRATAMYALMFPLIHFLDLVGVSIAVLCGMLAVVPETFVLSRRLLGLRTRDFAAMLAPGLVLTAATFIVVGLWLLGFGEPTRLQLPLLLLLTAGVYVASCICLRETAQTGPLQIIPHWLPVRAKAVAPSQMPGAT